LLFFEFGRFYEFFSASNSLILPESDVSLNFVRAFPDEVLEIQNNIPGFLKRDKLFFFSIFFRIFVLEPI